MNAKKVIIDCDPGIDDALALMLALRSPELRDFRDHSCLWKCTGKKRRVKCAKSSALDEPTGHSCLSWRRTAACPSLCGCYGYPRGRRSRRISLPRNYRWNQINGRKWCGVSYPHTAKMLPKLMTRCRSLHWALLQTLQK